MISKHPKFKPIYIASSYDELRKQPHMKQETILKTIPARDSWFPSFDEIRNQDDEYVSGKVEVRLMPWFKCVIYMNKFHVEKWNWRISIWGADDTGAEKTFDSKEDAQVTFDALDECPTRNDLYDFWGFSSA